MPKDYDTWNKLKKGIENDAPRIIHEGEIWWCSLGLNIGHEQDGKNQKFERPILIVKKFNNSVVWMVPLTSKGGDRPYYFPIEHNGAQYSLILSQSRLISTKRFSGRVRKVGSGTFRDIIASIKNLFP